MLSIRFGHDAFNKIINIRIVDPQYLMLILHDFPSKNYYIGRIRISIDQPMR